MDLIDYWAEEPPVHVTQALRYLGPSKRSKVVDEAQARNDMGAMGAMFGKQAGPLPEHLKALVRNAQQLKQQHKGL